MTELVNGVVRLRERLAWIVEAVSSRDESSVHPLVWLSLQMVIYELAEMDTPTYAINTYVELVKVVSHQGNANIVNAVGRNIDRSGRVPAPQVRGRRGDWAPQRRITATAQQRIGHVRQSRVGW